MKPQAAAVHPVSTVVPDTESRNAFLALVEIRRRATLTNRFLGPPRAGIWEPLAIVAAVRRECGERVDRAWCPAAAERERSFLHVIESFPDEAIAFAQWAIAYVEQPAEERAESRQAQRAQHINAWLADQTPTEKQIAFLRSLGHQGEVASKLHASQMIENLKRGGRK